MWNQRCAVHVDTIQILLPTLNHKHTLPIGLNCIVLKRLRKKNAFCFWFPYRSIFCWYNTLSEAGSYLKEALFVTYFWMLRRSRLKGQHAREEYLLNNKFIPHCVCTPNLLLHFCSGKVMSPVSINKHSWQERRTKGNMRG